ncbi:uncharacterized protein BDV14DRAFT_199586 [Aspergillus stella-maris]|uniref:uncharacterized protein n=1 Tax=Aspergillus stella-maris TaxID=1810926 RepID=UPI003CCCEF02
MRFLFTFLPLLAGFALTTYAAPTHEENTHWGDDTAIAQLNQTTSTPASWEVQPSPGAPFINLNGTVQEVYAQLLRINPDYEEDWKNVPDSVNPNTWLETWASAKEVIRDLVDPLLPRKYRERLTCYEPDETGRSKKSWASRRRILEGIEYLRKVKGRPTVGFESKDRCARVSCSYHSAIVWCNDEDNYNGRQTLDSFGVIADAAERVMNECWIPQGKRKEILGQLRFIGGWRVFVQGDSC